MSNFVINPYAFGAAEVATLSYIDTTTSTDSTTITGSASIIAGDILVLFDAVWNSGAVPPASSVPTDFVEINTVTAGTSGKTRGTLSYKKATGAEASASLTGMAGTGGAAKILSVFRGDVTATNVTAVDPGQESTAGDPSAQTITSGSGVPPLLVIGAYNADGAVDPRTFSPAKDGETSATGTYAFSWLAYKIYNTSPSDVSVDMDDEASDNVLMSCYLTVS